MEVGVDGQRRPGVQLLLQERPHAARLQAEGVPAEVDERAVEPARQEKLLAEARQGVGGVLNVLFHQRYFDSRNYPGYADLFERLIAEARGRRAWIAPVGEVMKAWSR